MSARRQFLGLCSTCRHAPGCTFRLGAGGAAWHCGEFDDEPDGMRPPKRMSVPEPEGCSGDTQVVGLCATCAERERCRLSRSASAVWHCEEFK